MRTHPATTAESRFILYARKSNNREDRQIRSLGDQVKLARAEAAQRGFHVAFEMRESKSAKRPGQREQFQEMVRLLEAGEADGILCWHPDRLARNGVDGGWILDLLDRGKLKHLHFLSFTFENTPEGKLMLGMIFSQAKYQVDKLTTDVTRGQREMREEGGFPHYVPEGYKNVRLDDGRKAVVKDLARFTLLRRAVDLILAEVYPPAEILRLLNGWGYQTRTTQERPGGPLNQSSFYRILHNPFYAGRCRTGTDWYQGKQEPLMSEAEFEQVQRILRRKEKVALRKHIFTYAGGLFTCGNCGCQITATFSTGRHKRGAWVYYHCTNRRGDCDRKGTREEIIEEAVRAVLRSITIPEDLVPLLEKGVLEALAKLRRTETDADESLQRRHTQAAAERDRLLPLLLKGVLTDTDYAAGRQALDEEIRKLSQRRESSVNRAELDRQIVHNVLSFAAHAASTFDTSPPAVRRRVVVMLAHKRVLTPNKPLLEPHPYLQGLIESAPKIAQFKPLLIRSYSTKESLPAGKLSFGRPNECRTEPDSIEETELEAVIQKVAQQLAEAIVACSEAFPGLYSL